MERLSAFALVSEDRSRAVDTDHDHGMDRVGNIKHEEPVVVDERGIARQDDYARERVQGRGFDDHCSRGCVDPGVLIAERFSELVSNVDELADDQGGQEQVECNRQRKPWQGERRLGDREERSIRCN